VRIVPFSVARCPECCADGDPRLSVTDAAGARGVARISPCPQRSFRHIDAYTLGTADRHAAIERLLSMEAPVDDWEVTKAEILRGAPDRGFDQVREVRRLDPTELVAG
jgi:hypothetical protein